MNVIDADCECGIPFTSQLCELCGVSSHPIGMPPPHNCESIGSHSAHDHTDESGGGGGRGIDWEAARRRRGGGGRSGARGATEAMRRWARGEVGDDGVNFGAKIGQKVKKQRSSKQNK